MQVCECIFVCHQDIGKEEEERYHQSTVFNNYLKVLL